MATIRIGTDESYDFEFTNPSNRDVMALERVFDGTFKDWANALKDGSITALTCLVFVLRKKTDPHASFNDVEFNVGDVSFVREDVTEPAEADEADPTPAGLTPSSPDD
jgi:hypothetical protein